MNQPDNPYKSPRSASFEQDQRQAKGFAQNRLRADLSISIEAKLITKHWFYREIQLAGGVEATIEYDTRGMGCEFVSVNGLVVKRAENSSINLLSRKAWILLPQIEFHLETEIGAIPVLAEIQTRAVMFVKAFRLKVNDQIVYHDGTWPEGKWNP